MTFYEHHNPGANPMTWLDVLDLPTVAALEAVLFAIAPSEDVQLRLTSSINDALRQDADIADLIWDVPQIFSYVSSEMTLLPGDVIATGTPASAGLPHHGDRITESIARIGTLTAGVDDSDAGACPTRGANRKPGPPEELTPVRSASSGRR